MKKFRMMKRSRRAEMGVGTMIIFIAMILVAAVAASVLISTANDVREQAEATGDEAINNVASGFIVQDVVGTVGVEGVTTTPAIDDVSLYVKLAAGSPDIDMDNVIVTINDGATLRDLTLGTAADADEYSAVFIGAGDDPDYWTNSKYVKGGDLIKITIDDATDLDLTAGTDVVIKIAPQNGSMTTETFSVPETIVGTTISL